MHNIALVGCRGYISGVYDEALRMLSNKYADIRLVCGVDRKNCSSSKQEQLPAYRSLAEMAKGEPEVNAVCLLTPPETHLPLALEALSYGLNVMIEKPPTLSYFESKQLAQAFDGSPANLFLAWHAQYAAGVDELQKLIKGQRLKSFSICYEEDVRNYRANGELKGYAPGATWDSGINAISVMTKLWGEVPLRVNSAKVYGPVGSQFETESEIEFFQGTMKQNWLSSNTRRTLSMKTAEGNEYLLDVHRGKLFANGEQVCCENAEHTMLGEYTRQCQHWLSCLRSAQSYAHIQPVRVMEDILRKADFAPLNNHSPQEQVLRRAA